MKQIVGMLLSAALLVGCGDSGPSALFGPDTLKYEFSDAGSIKVRGVTYPIRRMQGFDIKTGELFVTEYSTLVNGRKVTCVGDIGKCPDAIEQGLKRSKDDDHGGSY